MGVRDAQRGYYSSPSDKLITSRDRCSIGTCVPWDSREILPANDTMLPRDDVPVADGECSEWVQRLLKNERRVPGLSGGAARFNQTSKQLRGG